MSKAPAFDLDKARLEAAGGLVPAQFDEFQRLAKTLVHGPAFQWLLVDCEGDTLRKHMTERVDTLLRVANMRIVQLALNGRIANAAVLETRLAQRAGQADVVHLTGASSWFSPSRWDDLNQRRERLAQTGLRVLVWLDAPGIAQSSEHAPDLWAWRAGIYVFTSDPQVRPTAPPTETRLMPPWDAHTTMAQRHRRIAELREMLGASPPPVDELRVPLLSELSTLLLETGALDEVVRLNRDTVLPLTEQLGDLHGQVEALDEIGAALFACGDFDAALRVYQEELQPLLERLDHPGALAVYWGKIADVLHARGQFDASLQIRRKNQLPAFEQLGDQHAYALVLANAANSLHRLGQEDEALHILRTDVVPILIELDDQRSLAMAKGLVADILHDRGQLDEALRIHRDEQLPIFERLGDQRSRAITLSRIADALQARGDQAQAVGIWRDEVLPTYIRLGDPRAAAVAQANLAALLLARSQSDDRRQARHLLHEAQAAIHLLEPVHAQFIAQLQAAAKAS